MQGLEEAQIKTRMRYNEKQGIDNTDLIKRLREIQLDEKAKEAAVTALAKESS